MRVGFGTLAALLALGSSLALTAVVASADTVVVKYHSAYATAAFQTTVGRNPAFLVIDANDEFVDGVESSWLAVELTEFIVNRNEDREFLGYTPQLRSEEFAASLDGATLVTQIQLCGGQKPPRLKRVCFDLAIDLKWTGTGAAEIRTTQDTYEFGGCTAVLDYTNAWRNADISGTVLRGGRNLATTATGSGIGEWSGVTTFSGENCPVP